MKALLTVDELITHMKSKGIKFNIISEERARQFLCDNNYYMKLASYRKNYPKYQIGKKEGQYVNLEFAYLQELSTIDMHLRYLIIKMCLDIEHFLKVKLITAVARNPNDDGYEVVRKFLGSSNNEKILKKIKGHKSSGYCKDLIDKYYPYFPIWVFLELISFGDLAYLIDFYSLLYNEPIINNKFMNTVRDIRNASAHSNCLINKLYEELPSTQQPDAEITEYIKRVKNISSDARAKNLNYRVVYDFVTLLFVYDQIVPDGRAKNERNKELQNLVNVRMKKHRDYFISNTKITGIYNFLKKIVDNLNV